MMQKNSEHDSRRGVEAPVFVAREGWFEARVFRGDKPSDDAESRFARPEDHKGFYVGVWRRGDNGELEPFSFEKREHDDYDDWTQVVVACIDFVDGQSRRAEPLPWKDDSLDQVMVPLQRAKLTEALEILKGGGELPPDFIKAATSALVSACFANASPAPEEAIYVSFAQWNVVCQLARAGMLACWLGESFPPVYVDAWLVESVRELSRVLETSTSEQPEVVEEPSKQSSPPHDRKP